MYQLTFKDGRKYKRSAEQYLKLLVKELDEKRDFSVTFISDERMREMNREYRDIDSTTDVLSFALEDDDTFPGLPIEDIGDIFISASYMEKSADSLGVEHTEELARLLLHGLLHLRGWDHESNDFKTEPMLIEQERILKKLGITKEIE